MNSQTLTFSSLSSLHEHLRGGQIVRLVSASEVSTILIFIPSGQSPNQCRRVEIYVSEIGDVGGTSEPTEFSEWF